MICLQSKMLTFGDKVESIKSFEVWFSTPFGLCKQVEEAVESCKSRDIDPELGVKAVSVAVTETWYEVL